jgi:hypothetical protein
MRGGTRYCAASGRFDAHQYATSIFSTCDIVETAVANL